MIYWLKLLIGPVAFALVMLPPLQLPYEGRIALATFVATICWWVAQPMPWAIAALLPIVVFPIAGVMSTRETIQLYGQPIFFWIMGTVLMGYALEKHGLAKRFAFKFLSTRRIATRVPLLFFAHMLVTGLISMFVSDAATIAMMMPIGLSMVANIQTLTGMPVRRGTAMGAFVTLGTFYGAVAGGTGTILGLPHNAIAISLTESLAGRSITFFSWLVVGVPLFLVLLVAFYLILRAMVPLEIDRLPVVGGLLERERDQMGVMSGAEKKVLLLFAIMVTLFTLPAAVAMALGLTHPLTVKVEDALDIWTIPPILLFLLFLVPAGKRGGDTLLTWEDATHHTPWNAMILCMGAVAMVDALARFGFVEFMKAFVEGADLSRVGLTYVAAFVVAWSTDFMSGTAAMTLFGNIFIPAAAAVGLNPASMAMMIANVALGLTFPWAGAAAASAFSLGDVDMRQMIKVGIPITIAFATLAATIHLLLGHLV